MLIFTITYSIINMMFKKIKYLGGCKFEYIFSKHL